MSAAKARSGGIVGLALACWAIAAAAAPGQSSAGYRAIPLVVPSTGQAGFTRIDPAASGVLFTNWLARETYTTNQTFLNGSGVALGDVDGDGACDIYLCSLDGPDALYRNLGGWRFENATAAAGLQRSDFYSTSAALADLDGDGDLDLALCSIGQGTHLFFNDGTGRFAASGQAPLNRGRAAMSMALGDIEGDGDLDLYIANYRMISIRDQPNTRFRISTASGRPVVVQVNGRPVTEPDLAGRFELDPNGKIIEHGEPDAFYLNDGQGRFEPVHFTDGRFLDAAGQRLKAPLYDWGLSVMFRDINQDGAPDLYVCNDFNSPDRVWVNDGQGHFRPIAPMALRTTPLFSMGLDFADLDRDGFDEIFVVDMISRDHRKRHNQLPDILPPTPTVGEIENRPQYSRNALFLNRGDGTFAEIGQFSHLYASEWSWTAMFLDVDLDGYEDVLVATGNERDSMNVDVTRRLNARIMRESLTSQQMLEVKNAFARLDLPNLAFRNRGDLTFEEKGEAWGFSTQGISQGMALGDLDNDGDLDVVVNNLNGPAGLYRNEAAAARVAVRLKGMPGNTRGAGARITVEGGPVPQSQEMSVAGRYLSSDDSIRTFAAGSPDRRFRIRVDWRSGRRSVISGARANCLYEIEEAAAQESRGSPDVLATSHGREPGPCFEDVSSSLNHTHYETIFDDFARQQLLQRRLSQLGPGVAWFDLDSDGRDDLIIGSGAGGRLSVYRNLGNARFELRTDPVLSRPVTRDQSSVLGLLKGGNSVVLAGSSNYEDGLAIGPAVRAFDLSRQAIDDRLPGQPSSTGPLALADLRGDGEWALFVGGRVAGGRYPEPASSLLFRSTSNGWQLDADNTRRLRSIGLVSAALWSDLTGDGLPELILACEAGPLRVFRNEGGQLSEVTASLGFSEYLGLWNGVATGDFDGDGQLDLVATNWGWNQRYHHIGQGTLRLFYGDFLGHGSLEVIEAYWHAGMRKAVPFPGLDAVMRALPFVRDRVASHEAYGSVGVEELLGDRARAAQVLPVNTLASMLFLNRGSRWEARPLPTEAQLAPAFGVSIADLDGDGHEDLFLSQNFFAMQPEIPRMDAGRGLWLKGDGQGGFSPVPGQESGLAVYGEQRGCAVADFDQDGRTDLVVTQNGAATRLFRNVKAKPGVRIRLDAGAGNPCGIGAVVRLGAGERLGPAREIRAGSGYWSQDSAVQVMSLPGVPARVVVRWPGGQTTSSDVPPGAKQVTVQRDGVLKNEI